MKKLKILFRRYWAIAIFFVLALTATFLLSTTAGIAAFGWSLGVVAPKEQKEFSKLKAAREAEKRGLIKNQLP